MLCKICSNVHANAVNSLNVCVLLEKTKESEKLMPAL